MISFFRKNTKFELKDKQKIKNWIINTTQEEKFNIGDIGIIICDDKYLLNLNQKYLNHDTLTDIITFDYTENRIINSDIFISIERVKENAEELNIELDKEICRVIIHGVLHLMGYKDKTVNQKNLMTEKEDYYLSKYPKTRPIKRIVSRETSKDK